MRKTGCQISRRKNESARTKKVAKIRQKLNMQLNIEKNKKKLLKTAKNEKKQLKSGKNEKSS